MKPSEFFALVPEVDPALLKLPEVNTDENSDAVRLVDALSATALVDYEMLTGRNTYPANPQTPAERRLRDVYVTFLAAAALRFQKYQTALDAKRVHNPDVPQNIAFNLDLVRVIGRAERGALQRARKIFNGDDWLGELVSHAQP